MDSRAKLFGHPIHQMLIVFPLGLLATALAFDVATLITGVGYWSEISYWMILAGLVGGLAAAPFGLIDWLAILRRRKNKPTCQGRSQPLTLVRHTKNQNYACLSFLQHHARSVFFLTRL